MTPVTGQRGAALVAAALGVNRATIYRVLALQNPEAARPDDVIIVRSVGWEKPGYGQLSRPPRSDLFYCLPRRTVLAQMEHVDKVWNGNHADVASEGRLVLEPLDTGHLGDDLGRDQLTAARQLQQGRGCQTDPLTDPAGHAVGGVGEPNYFLELLAGNFSE